jgi:hypothetical protein
MMLVDLIGWKHLIEYGDVDLVGSRTPGERAAGAD